MRIFITALLGAFLLYSCNSRPPVGKSIVLQEQPISPIPDCDVAVRFINDYITHCLSQTPQLTDSAWVGRNPLLTERFKANHQKILYDAFLYDPEYGLGFDPILDAQDFPDNGFELVNCDDETGYVTVRGKDWSDFVLVLKIVQQNNMWLVDGAGIVNVPKSRKAKR